MNADRSVDYSAQVFRDGALVRCCEQGVSIIAVPAFRVIEGQDACEVGYALESHSCPCSSRWMAHDWRTLGHAQFAPHN